MKKIIKWTAIFVAMFCVSTLLSMVAGNDVSWAAFTENWDIGVLFAPLLTAACWALWPTPRSSYFLGKAYFDKTQISQLHEEHYQANDSSFDELFNHDFGDMFFDPEFSHIPGNIYYRDDD